MVSPLVKGLRNRDPAQGAFRLLRLILNGAVDDRLLVVNPCSKVNGARVDQSPERRTASLAELEAIADAMPEHMHVLVLLAGYVGLRRSELLGLERSDVDLVHATITIRRSVHWLRAGAGRVVQSPKTKAGGRTVAIPSSIMADVEHHLSHHVGPRRDAIVFCGEKGNPLVPHLPARHFRRARARAGREDLSFRDLPHTALTLAAVSGASVAELMHRAGHASPQAALRYQHASVERDRVVAELVAEMRPNAPVVSIEPKRQQL